MTIQLTNLLRSKFPGKKVSKVKQRVKNKLATRLKDDDDIDLYVDDPQNLMEPEEKFLKDFQPEDIERIIIIIIIIVKPPPPSIPKKKEWIIIYISCRLRGIFHK